MTVKKSQNTYYIDPNGTVKSGYEWLDDYKFEDIKKEDLLSLKKCFWHGTSQRWTGETEE